MEEFKNNTQLYPPLLDENLNVASQNFDKNQKVQNEKSEEPAQKNENFNLSNLLSMLQNGGNDMVSTMLALTNNQKMPNLISELSKNTIQATGSTKPQKPTYEEP